MFASEQNGCIPANMVVFGQGGCFLAIVVELRQNGCIPRIVVVFGQSGCCLG